MAAHQRDSRFAAIPNERMWRLNENQEIRDAGVSASESEPRVDRHQCDGGERDEAVLVARQTRVTTMRRSIILTPTARCAALVALALALTVAPPPWRGDDLAHATTKQQCQQKVEACSSRCIARAGYKPGMTREQFDQAFERDQNCHTRTCMHQLSNCLANASDGGKSALHPGLKSVRPGLLETTPGFTRTGPAATGSPLGTGAAPAGGAVLR